MNITILCTDIAHPVNVMLTRWAAIHKTQHHITIVRKLSDLLGGDILFLISCHEITTQQHRSLYTASLVIHASDLPQGKGWSPHIWQILEGKNHIVVSLIEAQDSIDSGDIWQQETLVLEGHELSDEINTQLFQIESNLMDFAIENCKTIQPVKQANDSAKLYSRRTAEDSRIDPHKTIAEQFDLLRVSDFNRYPAILSYRDCDYVIKIEKKAKNNIAEGTCSE